jgi:hypothetical protein
VRLFGLTVAICLGASTLAAQSAAAPRFELSAGISHFAQYVSADASTRQAGPTVALLFRSQSSASGPDVELAYTTVRQKATTASAAPRLDVSRVSLGWPLPLDSAARLALVPSLGAAWLRVDAQTIDCGEFPVCSEWAPYDASLVAGVLGLGLRGQLSHRWTLRAAGMGYLPLEDWQAKGRQSLLELRLTLGANF